MYSLVLKTIVSLPIGTKKDEVGVYTFSGLDIVVFFKFVSYNS